MCVFMSVWVFMGICGVEGVDNNEDMLDVLFESVL